MNPTDSHFERPDNFDLPAYWAGWCASFETSHNQYKVTLRIPPKGILLLAQVFGEGIHTLIEQITPDDSGCCQLTLTFESPEAACRQLFGLGAEIEIIAPAELRETMLATAKQVIKLYTQ